MRERTIKVDLDVKEVKILKYKQYDHNLLLKIIVCENKQSIDLSNYNAKAFFELPDKTVIQRNLKINNSIIHITLEDIILSQSGKTSLEVTVSNESQIVTFFTLYLDVEKSINRNVAVEGEPTWDILKDASETINKIKEIAEETEEDINNIETKINKVEENIDIVNTNVDKTIENLSTINKDIDKINEELDSINMNIENVENINEELDIIKKDVDDIRKEIPSLDGYAKEDYVDEKIENINLSNYVTKNDIEDLKELNHKHDNKEILDAITQEKIEEWDNKAIFNGDYNDLINKPSIPTKTSELTNDSGFITNIPNEYITETELNNKEYATQSWTVEKINQASLGNGEVNVDLSKYQTKIDNGLKTENKTITGSINEILEELNTIETTPGENGVTFIPNVDTNGNLSWSNNGGLKNPETINIKGEKGQDGEKGVDGKDGLTTSISVNNNVYTHVNGLITLPNYPSIPTKVSQLENDKNYLTSIPNEYITETELGNKNYLTSIPSEYITDTELNQKGYATETYVQNKIAETQLNGSEVDLSGYATKDDLNNKADIKHTHEINDINDLQDKLDDKLEISDLSNYATKNELPSVPTKVSQLENDKNYLTSIPDEYVTETELNNKGYATETFVANKIAEAQLEGEDIDLSGYATKDDLNNKADKSEIPVRVSQLTNDKNYLTSIPNEYVTDEELNQKGYLTEHQDLSDYALKNDLNEKVDKINGKGLSTEDYTTEEKNKLNNIEENANNYIHPQKHNVNMIEGLATVSTTGNYNDLTNKPNIPTKTSDLLNDDGFITSIPSEYITETELNNKGYITEHQDLSDYALKSEIPKDYLTSIPSEYITETELNQKGYVSQSQLNSKADTDDIPTKVSQLENDKNYLTSIPNEYVTETELNNKGYLTEHQDLSNYALKSEMHTHNNKTVLDNITSSKVSSWDNKSNFSGNYNDLTNKPTIPTKTSDLTNNSGYLTSVPSEYITTTELNTSLSNYALKSEIPQTNSNETLTTLTISNSRLTLSTDKRQIVTMVDNTTITLPTVSTFTEIHLYFTTSSEYTITFPTVKWQKTPSVTSGKTYEFIFTYVNSSVGWLGGYIEYTN